MVEEQSGKKDKSSDSTGVLTIRLNEANKSSEFLLKDEGCSVDVVFFLIEDINFEF